MDSSDSSVNSGWGVNEWSQADLKEYLNTMYYGGITVTCYNNNNNTVTTCPTGSLNENAKSMIDNHTWATGATNFKEIEYGEYPQSYVDTLALYNAERGMQTGKICKSGTSCNDTVARTTSWIGYVALLYIAGWVYASMDEDCNKKIDHSPNYKCKLNNWMHNIPYSYDYEHTLSPFVDSKYAYMSSIVHGAGHVNANDSFRSKWFRPTIYLKSNVEITSGTSSDPYKLEI